MLGDKKLSERTEEYRKKIKELEFEELNPKIRPKTKEEIIKDLINFSKLDQYTTLFNLNSFQGGISLLEAKKRLFQYGVNEISSEERSHWLLRFFKIIINPLILLLLFIILVSLITKDYRTSAVIGIMVIISVLLQFFQENQAYNSSESLKSMVRTTCTVIRNSKKREISLRNVVPGDVIELSAGDIVPADLRLLSSNKLFLNQSLLTGEALPVEKDANPISSQRVEDPLNLKNICYSGTNVESGHAFGVVIHTGANSYFGSLSKSIAGQKPLTDFEKGVNRFTWLMIGFMLVMVPIVFLVNGFLKGDWYEAFLFGISVAVGLTPEMLPAILTINLSKGAISMSKKKVIVKHLNSIQNFGAMNIFCTDKTGTLTLNKIVVIDNLNIEGKTDRRVIDLAYINSFFQSGFRNLLDSAVLKKARENRIDKENVKYEKVNELPFDFVRKRISVIVKEGKGKQFLVCKGAVEEITSICKYYELDGKYFNFDNKAHEKVIRLNDKLARNGFRVVAVAHRQVRAGENAKNISHLESDLVFAGFMTFLDPPKQSAKGAIGKLEHYGVKVKILTGDNEMVTEKIARDVGVKIEGVLLGKDIDRLEDRQLKDKVEHTTIFAKLSPDHKRRIVETLKDMGNVVGFLGDGINDAPALRVSDVGISVDDGVDIAKESAGIILLDQDLNVLVNGIKEGRRVFANIIKYIRMGASSNFGNMISVLGASLFLPFLPMKPSQILINNLLYSISQTATPLDNVDKDFIAKPRRWEVDNVGRFMFYIGPISSIFDYLTFFIMIYIFNALSNPTLFQTGWFVESLASQTLIVHIIRSKRIPFVQTWASLPLTVMTALIIVVGIALVYSPYAGFFDFVPLPVLFWPLLLFILILYVGLTQIIKNIYIKKFGYE